MILPDRNLDALSMIYRKIAIWKNEQSEGFGLTAAQVPIVILVCNKEGISQYEVVEELALDKSVIAKSVIKLISSGYLIRRPHPKDKRAYILFPTQKAKEVFPLLIEQGNTCMDLLTTGMTYQERAELNGLLEHMRKNLCLLTKKQ